MKTMQSREPAPATTGKADVSYRELLESFFCGQYGDDPQCADRLRRFCSEVQS